MKLSTLTLAAIMTAGAAIAGPVAPADVVFSEGAVAASLSGQPGDVANGAKIMSSKKLGNCIACHEVTALSEAPFHGEVGPLLDGVGDRWNQAELRGILSNAKLTYEGTVMPAYYKVDGFNRPGKAYTGKAADGPLDPLLSAQQIEDVVAFLMTLKDE
ncbi:sulfur-oxidizing protein SoxX [Shimia gijangensis]|uniref:Sulfur-oxidizing protein SoxX n=1 Tax=Shimia gijangensis TaxID=1470563 RepID=A0A1M6P2K6_9RHOB|nr:sulfur oxidation c-type cytochrome SoxX [Shimia gijangensis]SHK02102.1 sulfur-oxidizing protein SoxX [Shimia gijangensis]